MAFGEPGHEHAADRLRPRRTAPAGRPVAAATVAAMTTAAWWDQLNPQPAASCSPSG